MLEAAARYRFMLLNSLAVSMVLCAIPLSPSLCERPSIDVLAAFPSGTEATRGRVRDAPGGMIAEADGGVSYARGLVKLPAGGVGAGGRLEMAGRFRFDAAGRYVSILRADDYAVSGPDAVQLGIEREHGDGRLHVVARRYDGSWQGVDIEAPAPLVPGREYDLRLRATVSAVEGAAETELWIDARLVARSSAPNTLPGRAYVTARAGAVAVADSRARVVMRDVRVAADGGGGAAGAGLGAGPSDWLAWLRATLGA